jgi:pyruvate formate-lyase activating enzyme-like uncharacterized protein
MTKRIEKTPYHSYKIGFLPKGCKMCVKGRKLVLFITGICNRKCCYCPISDEKKDKDIIYANEWCTDFPGGELRPEDLDIIIEEAQLSGAEGAGITGGDPLLVLDRTVSAILRLKKKFGRKFHIHLYTSLENVTKEKLKLLFDAGLDEIRFHPDIENPAVWDRIILAKGFRWDIGVEIPVIPFLEKETFKLLDYLDGKIDFLNLNELELSDSSANKLHEMGCNPKDEESYAVEGSEEMAIRLMDYVIEKEYRYTIHYCTVRLKDGVQMARRIKHRSKNAATEQDRVTSEGMLIRGVIYLKDLTPGFGYRKKLKEMNKEDREKTIAELEKAKDDLVLKLRIKTSDILTDEYKLRLLTSEELVRKHSKEIKVMDYVVAVVEEYPTKDALELDVEFL